jgi:hypothetical protein
LEQLTANTGNALLRALSLENSSGNNAFRPEAGHGFTLKPLAMNSRPSICERLRDGKRFRRFNVFTVKDDKEMSTGSIRFGLFWR